jgi:ribosomal protein S18 acetylase RimI-like enzyme
MNELGWRYKDDPNRLIEHFRDVVDQYPTTGRAKFELANALDYFGQEAQAVPLYKEAMSLGLSAEYDAYARLQLGSSLRNIGRIEEAVSLLRDAEDRYPQMPSIRMFLALALYAKGQADESLKVALQTMLRHINTHDVERFRPALESYIEEMGDAVSSITMDLSVDKDNSQTDHPVHPAPIHIRRLEDGEQPPMDLLLLADPSEKLVVDYAKRGTCWVAEVGDMVVGVYVLMETRPQTVELVNIAVRGDVQGNGIGKRLISHAIEIARKEGFRNIEVGTANSSVDQLRLYQKCGFRIVGVDLDFFVRHYDEPIYENGIQCRDMIRLNQDL